MHQLRGSVCAVCSDWQRASSQPRCNSNQLRVDIGRPNEPVGGQQQPTAQKIYTVCTVATLTPIHRLAKCEKCLHCPLCPWVMAQYYDVTAKMTFNVPGYKWGCHHVHILFTWTVVWKFVIINTWILFWLELKTCFVGWQWSQVGINCFLHHITFTTMAWANYKEVSCSAKN